MNKHTATDLIQMQSLPLELKIKMTQRRIRDWYEHYDGDVYVSFSGGKDSTVLKHIVDGMYKDVPSLFINTGLEYPEIQGFAMSQPNTITVRPDVSFKDVLTKYGYPIVSKEVAKVVYYARSGGESNVHYKKLFGTLMYQGEKSIYCIENWSFLYDAPFKISAYCCDLMKKKPAHKYEKETGRKPIIATMAEESRNRMTAWIRTGCNAFEAKRPSSKPMSFWTEQDVLHYLVENKVPYCSIYGDIVHKQEKDEIKGQISIADIIGYSADDQLETTGAYRTGCIFCMFGCHLDKEPNRFQRLKETHPKQYAYCIGGGEFIDGMWMPNKDGLGLGFVLDYLGVKY